MKIASFVLSLLVCPMAAVAVEVPAAEIRKIFIVGNAANVDFTGDAKLKVFQINLSTDAQAVFDISNRDGIIEIRGNDLKNKETFGKSAAANRGISIRGPSRPADVHLMQGKVTASGWQETIFAVLQKGDFLARAGEGALNIHLQKGQIEVHKHRGKVTVDTYSANTVLKAIEGDLKVENFAGDSAIDSVSGNMAIKVGTGGAKVSNSGGTLDFEAVKGTVSSQGFKGRVEGEVGEGNAVIAIGQSADIRVKSQSGKVTVTGAEKVGAFLNASTQGGDIFGPSYMKVTREGALKYLKGRTRGGTNGGAVVVKSQDGTIFLK